MLGGCRPSFENVEIWLRCYCWHTFLAHFCAGIESICGEINSGLYFINASGDTRRINYKLESCRCGTSSILSLLTQGCIFSGMKRRDDALITLLILCQERAARANASPKESPPARRPHHRLYFWAYGVPCYCLAPRCRRTLIIHSEISVRAWSADQTMTSGRHMLTPMLATSLGALVLVQHQGGGAIGLHDGGSGAFSAIIAAIAGVAFSLPLRAPASQGPRARMLVFAASVRTAGALATPRPKIGDQEYGPHSEIEHVKRHGVRCGTDEHPHLHDDEHGRALAKSDCGFSTDPKPIYSPSQGPIYRIKTCIPVIMSSDGQTGAISQACIHGGMVWLNRDFRATAGQKSANSVDTRIEFQLIKTLEHKNTAWMIQEHGTPGGFWDAATGECDVNRAANIFIKTPPSGILGQANLAHYASGTAPDGSTIGTSVWGPCATSGSYNEGATATHELGHYLGLYHTFVSGNQDAPLPASSCPAQTKPGCYERPGDTLCDTNAQANAEYACDNENECGEDEPVHNFMDYSHDSCLTTFTEEQARRMRCALTSYRSGIYTEHAGGWVGPLTSPNPPSWPTAPSPPTRSCTCQASWTYDGVTSSGCANPDQDPSSPWCFSNEGTGCLLPDSNPSTYGWFYCMINEPPPSPNPPPSPLPPNAAKCSCKASWSNSGRTAAGCANPDNDRGGEYCYSNEGRGCIKPNGLPATLSYFYCTPCVCAASWIHEGISGAGCSNAMCVTVHGRGCILADGTQATADYAPCTPPSPPPPVHVKPPSPPAHPSPPPGCPCPSIAHGILGDGTCDRDCNVRNSLFNTNQPPGPWRAHVTLPHKNTGGGVQL